MYKYKASIIIISNLHHGRKEVALSPEQLVFSTKAGGVATLRLIHGAEPALTKPLHLNYNN